MMSLTVPPTIRELQQNNILMMTFGVYQIYK
jgi:hypothetical protein